MHSRDVIRLALAAAALFLAGGMVARSGVASIASSCPAGSPGGDRIGVVTDRKRSVYVNRGTRSNTRAQDGTKLYVGTAVCVDERALILFDLEAGGSKAHCNVAEPLRFVLRRTKANVLTIDVVPPGTGANLLCKGTSINVKAGPTSLKAASTDPVFRITFGRKATEVRVESGFVEARTAGDEAATVVGPDQRAVAVADNVSRAVEAPPLPPGQRRALARLAGAQPKPDFERPLCVPGRCTSPTLLRIFRRRAIVLGIDPGAGADAREFTTRFFGFVARSWKLRLRTTTVPRAADVFVAPNARPRAQTIAFFADRSGNSWLMNVFPDPVFADALRNFLQAALDTGKYGSLYEASFPVRAPPYAALAPLLFTPPACLPGRSTGMVAPPSLSLEISLAPTGPIASGTPVRQTVEVTNQGAALDCATVRLRVFGADLLDRLTVRGRACEETTDARAAQRAFRCDIGPLGAGASRRVELALRPSAALRAGQTVQSCAEVDADGARPREEELRQNNAACVEILGRRPLLVGAAEDAGQEATLDDAKATFDLMRLAGFRAVVTTAVWKPKQTALPPEEASRLANAVAAADLAGIRVFLSIYGAPGAPLPLAGDRAAFAAFVASVARAFPKVRDVVIGNEPNSSSFWTPQFAGRKDAAAPAYEALLASAYDALKRVDRGIRVIGGALAPRGDDSPGRGHDHSPKTFIEDLGAAYRKSPRRKPIMDAFAFHPMPETPGQQPDAAYPADSTALALANYERLVVMLDKAFANTRQPGSTLPILYTEYGVETGVPLAKAAAYSGSETAAAVAAAAQARSYAQAFAIAACQPTVEGLFVFHAFDEPALDRWQSGVYYADGSPKPSLAAVRRAADRTSALDTASCLPRAR